MYDRLPELCKELHSAEHHAVLARTKLGTRFEQDFPALISNKFFYESLGEPEMQIHDGPDKEKRGNRTTDVKNEDETKLDSENENVKIGSGHKDKIIASLREDIIGEHQVFSGPYGSRKGIYLDDTASGRSLKSIETFIWKNVLPTYGNTHTTTSYFASQMSIYRKEARELIRKSCAGGSDDEVIFCGSGSTGAIQKLVQSIQNPEHLLPPIVLIGPFEHHSNILPWRETTKEVINLRQDTRGLLDMKYLEAVLKSLKHKQKQKSGRRLLIGVFSAASNVTGVMTDDVAVTVLMHKYGGLAFWDYAAAAPHLAIRMNPQTGDPRLDKLARKDALYFSGHKFTGGPQTTGVLVAKRSVFHNPVPHGAGGGTVLFVTSHRHQYLQEIHVREEGGTPPIVESIRLGLVFQLKNIIGIPSIITREWEHTKEVLDAFNEIPEIIVLGSTSMPRIPIVSFMVKHTASGYFLHHDFVVAILNDLFGIQCRGGCMCAGPYAQNLLGINDELAIMYEKILGEPRENVRSNMKPSYDVIFKPGFVRLSLPYHVPKDDIRFTISAIKLIAECGWKILPLYKFDPANGTFRCAQNPTKNEEILNPISSFQLAEDQGIVKSKNIKNSSYLSHAECLEYARGLINKSRLHAMMNQHTKESAEPTFKTRRKPFRWFMLPSDALGYLRNEDYNGQSPSPFVPVNYDSVSASLAKQWLSGSIPDQIWSSFSEKN